MTTYQVSGCVHRFECLFGLAQDELNTLSGQPTLKDLEDANLLEKTIFNYSKKDSCCGIIKQFFYLVWQVVKRIFCSYSDWQKTTRMLSERAIAHFDYEGMSDEQRKAVKEELRSLVVDQFFVQVLQANEQKKESLGFLNYTFSTASGGMSAERSAPEFFSSIRHSLHPSFPQLTLLIDTFITKTL